MKDNLLLSLKVLYVEDDDDTRDELADFLRKRVGKLIVARNGEEGYEKFLEHHPNLIITDSRMPKLDGIAMSAKIRETDQDAAIIVTTAFSDVEAVIKAIDMGINKYILKPVSSKELIESMRDCAFKVLNKTNQNLMVGEQMVADVNEKKELEKNIQNRIAAFLKDKTGKGPKFVRSFLNVDMIEIEAADAFTKYELSLLEKGKNERIVNFVRESFYTSYKKEIETMVSEVLNVKCVLESVDIDSYRKKDKLLMRVNIKE